MGKNFSSRLRNLMENLGFTQKELADAIGTSQPAVSLYLKGRIPPADILYRIARLDNTTVEWLLSGKEDYPQMTVGEKKPHYGREAVLLERWSRLNPKLQKVILNLMKDLVDAVPEG
ncbi:MAG: XRE family transcriptional regulator [Calditrichaeota bacterium]|nr:helix-turn-helix transcriptional regulator [Calditrichota bacterium]RQW06958.1 MAG: XRE family transcriptional regulator [Calditrichota bacterium]